MVLRIGGRRDLIVSRALGPLLAAPLLLTSALFFRRSQRHPPLLALALLLTSAQSFFLALWLLYLQSLFALLLCFWARLECFLTPLSSRSGLRIRLGLAFLLARCITVVLQDRRLCSAEACGVSVARRHLLTVSGLLFLLQG